MTPVLVFDIETIPDVTGLRLLHRHPDAMTDDAVAQAAVEARQAQNGSTFLPHHLHRVAAISCVFRDDQGFRVRSLGSPEDGEARLVADFFRVIQRYTPQLVSWNGSGFDLPVLHYRALALGVPAPRYWDQGEEDREFRWNHYLGRYHSRHLDMMDFLALYNSRAYAPLDDIARLCGFPGKQGVDGAQVWPLYQRGRLQEIRDYCETDVVNTYLVYCRFQFLRGQMSAAAYEAEIALVRSSLAELEGCHWPAFLDAWPRQQLQP
ncbi:3'-5' exonuclease [Noviherbaspirillum sp. 1P10PC]|uniref:3'-5' exonuclease n=1 Tax=Noviherbaspirillum sp. 1P10PC TaxID=3132292 RepID=UPI0039A00F9E